MVEDRREEETEDFNAEQSLPSAHDSFQHEAENSFLEKSDLNGKTAEFVKNGLLPSISILPEKITDPSLKSNNAEQKSATSEASDTPAAKAAAAGDPAAKDATSDKSDSKKDRPTEVEIGGKKYKVEYDKNDPAKINKIVDEHGKVLVEGDLSIDKEGRLNNQLGSKKLIYDKDLKISEVQDRNGKTIEKVGENGSKSIRLDSFLNVIAELENGNKRVSANGDERKVTLDKKGNAIEVQDSNFKTIEKVGENGVKSISLKDGKALAQLEDGSVRATDRRGEQTVYKDEVIADKLGEVKRSYLQPPGMSQVVRQNSDGTETILEVKNGDKVIAKVGKNGIKQIDSMSSDGLVNTTHEDGKTHRVIGQDGNTKSEYTERHENGKTIRSFRIPAGTEISYENGKPTEISYNKQGQKETWKIGPDGTATREGGKGEPVELRNAKIDENNGTVSGEALVKNAKGVHENVNFTFNPDGSSKEIHRAKDKSGKEYEYSVSKDKEGYPSEIKQPVLDKNGNIVDGVQKKISFQYETDKDGKVKTKDGQPVAKRVEVEVTDSKDANKSEKYALTKGENGKWQLSEFALDKDTGKMVEQAAKLDSKGKPIEFDADVKVKPDGSLVMNRADGGRVRINPDGSLKSVSAEELGEAPATKAEKEAQKKKSEIVKVGTQEDGKPTWGQGVPNVLEQWGFGDWGAERGSFGPQRYTGDQGYDFTISQEVDKDGNIAKRETKFETPNGVSIYYRDQNGEMKELTGVTSMVSERQPDGTYKITYHVKGENPNDSAAPKPVVLNTTIDGRHVDADGIPIGEREGPPKEPDEKQQPVYGPEPDRPQNIRNLEKEIRDTDTSTPEGKQKAKQLIDKLLQEKIAQEDAQIKKAAGENNREAMLEAERRKATLKNIAGSESRRSFLLARIKKSK